MVFTSRYRPVLWLIVAWGWALLAGCGGLVLLIEKGPLPLTNGWFALASGISACPLTSLISKKLLGVTLSGRVQLVAAALFFIAGHVALKWEYGHW